MRKTKTHLCNKKHKTDNDGSLYKGKVKIMVKDSRMKEFKNVPYRVLFEGTLTDEEIEYLILKRGDVSFGK